jgi:hypothetical protein
MGSLPEQTNSNLATLQRLQLEQQSLAASLQSARQRLTVLEQGSGDPGSTPGSSSRREPSSELSTLRARLAELKRPLTIALGVAAVVALVLAVFAYGELKALTFVGLTAGLWILYSALREPVSRLRRRQTLSAAVLGMSIAHLGVGVFTVGVTTVESYKIERDIAMRPGDSATIAGYTFTFLSQREPQWTELSCGRRRVCDQSRR